MKKKFTFLMAMMLGAASIAAEAATMEVSATWEAPAPLVQGTSWNNSKILEVPATPFKNSLSEKSVIRFHFKDVASPAQLQINYKADDTNWTWTTMVGYVDITGTTLDFAIADALDPATPESTTPDMEDMIAGIKAHGLHLKGYGYTLTGVDVLNPEGEGPVDPMKDYELSSSYTLETPLVIAGWKEAPVGNEGFSKLTPNSYVKLIFTDCGANPQVQVAYKSGAGMSWTQYSEYENVEDGAFMFPLSGFKDAEDAAQWIKARGLILKGQQCTLSGIEVYNRKGETPKDPLEGYIVSQTYNLDPALVQTSWKELVVPSGAFKNLIEQSVVRFVFTELGTDPQLQLNYKADDANWTWTTLVDCEDLSGKVYEYWMKDAADVADAVAGLKAHGAWLKGQNWTLSQVIILNPEGVGPEPEVEMTVTGTYVCEPPLVMVNAWSDILEVPASAFTTVTTKSQINLHFSDCTGGQAQIVYKADDADMTWTQLEDYTNIEAGKIEFAVADFKSAEGAAAGLKANGLFLKGQKFTLNKVEVLNPKNSHTGIPGVGEPTEIDWNAPVEIYTLSGARVAGMETGNVYIVRQGATVKKIAK